MDADHGQSTPGPVRSSVPKLERIAVDAALAVVELGHAAAPIRLLRLLSHPHGPGRELIDKDGTRDVPG
jgi:hypothetical protein